LCSFGVGRGEGGEVLSLNFLYLSDNDFSNPARGVDYVSNFMFVSPVLG
jgi:hypothetical protein